MKLLNLLKNISCAPEYTIAFDQVSLSSSQWLGRVALWQKQLTAAKDLHRVAVFVPDSAELSAVLVALWLCAKEAWLAPNNLLATTQQLSTRVDGFIGDFPQVATVSLGLCKSAISASNVSCVKAGVLASDAILVLFTSGSSGEPQLIRKKVSQLAAEVEQLERSFGEALGECRVFATVSHQHIYGLLFRVLWPLACGRAFSQFTAEYVEQVFVGESQPLCLVSSPTHLTRLPENIAHKNLTRLVFSSGGPLPSSASACAHRGLQADIIEVYGSTETGGIGWRSQHQGEGSWALFEVVQAKLSEQKCLMIKSPFLYDDDWFETSDIVSMQSGKFTLAGRADRVAKIEGKRVSLEQIESYLMADDWVQDVRVEPVVRAGAVANRDELMALVVLSPKGMAAQEESGRQGLAKHFKGSLGQLLERPLVPRRWRYVDSLPRNTQGKIQHQALQQLIKDMQRLKDRSQ